MTEGGNDMEGARRLDEDLGYVREVVYRAERGRTPRAIWYLWAAISAVGFALQDFRPDAVPVFWAIAGPLGFVASAWLGSRHSRSTGQESSMEGRAYMLHWAGMGGAIALLVVLAERGGLSHDALGAAILLVVALAYFLAGVHLVRSLLWVGLALAFGFLAVVFLEGYVWTAVGALLAVALIISAHVSSEGRERAAGI